MHYFMTWAVLLIKHPSVLQIYRNMSYRTVGTVIENCYCRCYVLQFCFLAVAVNTCSGSDQEHAQHQSQPPSCASLFSAVPGSRLVFKDSEVYFHSDLSEKLLTALSEKGKLCDLTMTLFDSNTTRLR